MSMRTKWRSASTGSSRTVRAPHEGCSAPSSPPKCIAAKWRSSSSSSTEGSALSTSTKMACTAHGSMSSIGSIARGREDVDGGGAAIGFHTRPSPLPSAGSLPLGQRAEMYAARSNRNASGGWSGAASRRAAAEPPQLMRTRSPAECSPTHGRSRRSAPARGFAPSSASSVEKGVPTSSPSSVKKIFGAIAPPPRGRMRPVPTTAPARLNFGPKRRGKPEPLYAPPSSP
mmetsp:Transcript_30725/g.96172  ORF Transcript_30725/g.96172 Transcript_30725/m.96172 type:complete len:229 (+) Transcript_30725:178-864(+)